MFLIYNQKNFGVDKKQELIYRLVFEYQSSYLIDLGEFVDDIYRYDEFVDEIRDVLRKSKVMIVKSSIKVDSKTAIWELKLKK